MKDGNGITRPDTRKGWNDYVKVWLQENPNWRDSESCKRVFEGLESDKTVKNYRFALPRFFAFIDQTPDQVWENRREQSGTKGENYDFYEQRMRAFKAYLISLDLSKSTIKGYLAPIGGYFSRLSLTLKLEKSFWKPKESTKRRAERQTINPLVNEELRAIFEIADTQTQALILFGYHCGLTTTDVSGITWKNLNLDLDNEKIEFSTVDYSRNKTDQDFRFVVGPDLRYVLKKLRAETRLAIEIRNQNLEKTLKAEEGKENPKTHHAIDTNYVFVSGIKGTRLLERFVNEKFKNITRIALGEKRQSQITYTNLRDSYNEALVQSGIPSEIKDVLFGHKRQGAKSNYPVGEVISHYKEKVYPLLTVNGWREKTNNQESITQLKIIQERETKMRELLQAKIEAIETGNKKIETDYGKLALEFQKLAIENRMLKERLGIELDGESVQAEIRKLERERKAEIRQSLKVMAEGSKGESEE